MSTSLDTSFDTTLELELSCIFIELATEFQLLHPHQMTEFMNLIQDEYVDLLQQNEDQMDDITDDFDDLERQVVQHVLAYFYRYYDSPQLASMIEKFVHQLANEHPMYTEWIVTFGKTLFQYLQDCK